jgi:hypothetical protein
VLVVLPMAALRAVQRVISRYVPVCAAAVRTRWNRRVARCIPRSLGFSSMSLQLIQDT